LEKELIKKILESDVSLFYSSIEIPVPDSIKKWNLEYCFKGEVKIGNNIAPIIIGFQKFFPYNKPLYFLEHWDLFGFIPHIDPDGYVCYIQEENLVLDSKNPSGIINSTLESAIEIINRGREGLNHDDFLNEFESYWNRYNTKRKLLGGFVPNEEIIKIRIGICEKFKALGNTDIQIKELIYRLTGKNLTRFDNAIYIPIKEGQVKKPPPFNKFWNHTDILDFVYANISKEKIKEALGTKINKDEYIVFGIPKPNSQKALACVVYRTKKNDIHPLLNLDPNLVPEPVLIESIAQDVIVPRGGGNKSLNQKKVLIVGCGSLGSQIACDVAKTGISFINVCDYDILKYENIYRHALGNEYVGQNKSEAIKLFIEKQMPFTKVRAFPYKVEYLISDEDFNKSNFDALVIATGNATVNLYINQIIKAIYTQIPVIYTWIEPYGIGGHALLTTGNNKGCYNCLYDEKLYNKASFAHYDQPSSFAKNIAGCGSLFVPFSYLDTTRTSNLATRLLISYLTGKETGNPLLSWKGNSELFIKEGYLLSRRHIEQTEEKMFENRYKYVNELCQDCGTK
jgi:molybdopterin-synthase adenylyltransferase